MKPDRSRVNKTGHLDLLPTEPGYSTDVAQRLVTLQCGAIFSEPNPIWCDLARTSWSKTNPSRAQFPSQSVRSFPVGDFAVRNPRIRLVHEQRKAVAHEVLRCF